MLKKYAGYSTIACLLIGSLASCGGASTESETKTEVVGQEEELHNPASLEVPKEAEGLVGRWDLTVDKGEKKAPSWLEIKVSGYNTLVGAFVSEAGSSRPVSHIVLKEGKFSFAIPPQWEGGEGDFKIDGELAGSDLKGTITSNKGETFNFTGVKAPYLNRTGDAEWGTPVVLFNGTDLKGWKPSSDENNKWIVKDGILINTEAGANLISEQTYEDFKLTAEFRYAEGGNAGIYLRGRYEVQIEDSPKDRHPGSLYFGGVYGFLSPNQLATNGPGEWNTYEITLRGRLVTIVANGKTIISEQEIPGITGGALDSNEGEPGPIYLQGDHTGVEFRKLVITPAK